MAMVTTTKVMVTTKAMITNALTALKLGAFQPPSQALPLVRPAAGVSIHEAPAVVFGGRVHRRVVQRIHAAQPALPLQAVTKIFHPDHWVGLFCRYL